MRTDLPPAAHVDELELEGRGWVILQATSERHLLVLSCHQLTDPLRTLAGTIQR